MSRRKAFDTSLTGGAAKGKGKAPQSEAPTASSSSPPAHSHDDEPTVSQTAVTQSRKAVATPPPEDGHVCFICAEPVTYWAVGTCNHHVCQYVGVD